MNSQEIEHSKPRGKLGFLSFFQSGFLSNPHYRYSIISALLINSIMWVLILIKIKAEAKPVPLHFNAFYGIELVGNGFIFLQLPLIGLLLLIVNTVLAIKVFKAERFLAMLLVYGSVLLQLLLLAAVFSFLMINS